MDQALESRVVISYREAKIDSRRNLPELLEMQFRARICREIFRRPQAARAARTCLKSGLAWVIFMLAAGQKIVGHRPPLGVPPT